MPTFAETLGALDDEHFVGRERELALFRAWLAPGSARPAILNVVGRGGIGKSTLLRAFARIAGEQGQAVVQVDGRGVAGRREGLLQALGGESVPEAVARLNAVRPVVLLDTLEELGELARYLADELLPQVEADVKVVISGRYPLGRLWSGDSPWQRLIRPMALEGFSPEESQGYLSRRGLAERSLVAEVLSTAGGNPLALALAADMVLQLGVRQFAAVSERHLLLRTLVEQLLRDVREPALRDLLEVCAVVREFDEALLATVSAHEDITAGFDQLCQLSVVRPSEHGLRLHDDVRRALAEDLRWRQPERHAELRRRALAYYRERSRTAPLSLRERLVAERLYLLGDTFVQMFLFQEEDQEPVWLEYGRPEDHDDCVDIWLETLANTPEEFGRIAYDPEFERIHLQSLLSVPGARLHIARDPAGPILGFGLAVPLHERSLESLERHPAWAPLIRLHRTASDQGPLPRSAEFDTAYAHVAIGQRDTLSLAGRSALYQAGFSVLALGGLYLAITPVAAGKQMFSGIGFEMIPEARNWACGDENPVDGFVLDLRSIGFEVWLEAILSGRRPPKALAPEVLERELQAAFASWHDDAVLAGSPLTQIPAVSYVAAEGERPEVLRQTIRLALERAQGSAKPGDELAYRALELTYLQRGLSHDRAAERLAVSRATFYRLLKRGVQGVAAVLSAR